MDFSKIGPNTEAVAVLVSNDYRPLGKDYELYGTHNDANKLGSLFMEFGYVVYKWQNVSYKDFLSCCESLAGYPYPQTCTKVIIFFAGHGDDGVLMMQDKEYINIDGIMELFKPDIAKNVILATIAKIFLIDACRGREKDDGCVSQDRARGGPSQSTYKVRAPIEGNFLVAYGSTRFYKVFETPAGGRWGGRWTSCLIKALQGSKETDKAEDVIKNANKMMRKQDAHCFQTAEYTSNLIIDVFFKGTDEPQSADLSQYKVESLWSQKELDDMIRGKKISIMANEELLKEVVLLVLTVSEIEHFGVLYYLEPLTGHTDIYEYMQLVNDGLQSKCAIYLIGKYGAIPTAVRQIEPGSAFDGATTAPNLAFRCFKSLNAIIGVGVACGVEKHTKLFDVIVASEVRNYDQARLDTAGTLNRGMTIRASKLLSSIFRQPIEWLDNETKERLDKCNVPEPKIKQGVILSGPYLINNSKVKNELIQNFAPEAIGIEMEATYLFRAACDTPIHMTIVKAVCHFGDGRKIKHFQPTAALLAANCLKKYFHNQQVLKILQRKPEPGGSDSLPG